MKNKQTAASGRRIAFSYFVDYASPITERPNNVVVLGDRREEGRWSVSHRRPIKDNNDKQIGDASYFAHVYRVDLADDKKSGLMYADFSAHHEFKKDGKDYDIYYEGTVKFALGIRGPQQEVDPLFPINHIQKVDPECVSAREIFENKIKINSGKNIVVLKRNKENVTNYRIAAFTAFRENC